MREKIKGGAGWLGELRSTAFIIKDADLGDRIPLPG
jgi:hypothetical protein